MRKFTFLLLAVLLSLAMVNVANANLLLNAGFEDGPVQTAWTLGDFAIVKSGGSLGAHSGTYYGQVGYNQNGSFWQQFELSGGGILEYGAYIQIFTNDLSGNFDQVQISMQVSGDNFQPLGGSTANFDSSLFTNNVTGWFLLSGTIDLSGYSAGDIAGININIQQNTSANGYTGFRVDDAYAGVAPVPEPSTLLLLGSGLVGLVAYRRRKRMM